mgnify:CR=1 FL=1
MVFVPRDRGEDAPRRWLVMEDGRVRSSGDLPAGRPPPVPAAGARSIAERRARRDDDARARLGVLTAELRRLAAAGRLVALYLDGDVALDARRARRLLEAT